LYDLEASDYPQTLDGLFDLEVTYPAIEPQQLRVSVRLRQTVARDFEQIQASVGEMLVGMPRRAISGMGTIRPLPSQPCRATC